MSRCTVQRRRSYTWVTRRDITAPWFRRAAPPWFTGRDGLTRRTSVRQRGTDRPTPMAWGLDSRIAADPDGASGSAMDMLTIPGITRGGDRCRITATAGIPTLDGELGEERQGPTSTASGAIPLTRARVQPGPILTLGITVPEPAGLITITRRAG